MASSGDKNHLLDQICRQMEASFVASANGDVALVFDRPTLPENLPGTQIVEISPTKVVAAVQYTWVLPFDLFQVTSVAPNAVDECCGPLRSFVAKANETQFRSYTLEHQFGDISYSLCSSSALRQRFNVGHVGFIIAGVSHPFVINGSSVSGVTLSNRCIMRFSRLPHSPNSTDVCQIDIATQVEIDVSHDAESEHKTQPRDLAKAVIDMDRGYFDNFIGTIESTVLQKQTLSSSWP